MSVAFRFLHLSDLLLGEPISGVREPSDALREQLLAAPYAAAEAAFDAAVREQVDAWIKRTEKHVAGAQIAEAGKRLIARLAAAEEHLIQVKAKGSQDTLNFPTMLNAKLSFLAALAGASESGPTRAQEQLCADLATRVEEQVRAVDIALAEDLPAFNALVRNTDVPAVVVPEGEGA